VKPTRHINENGRFLPYVGQQAEKMWEGSAAYVDDAPN
jgi:hypothetical protein